MESSAESILTNFEKTSNLRPGDCNSLVEMACRNMAILEPWNHATSKHPDAMKIIERVQDNVAEFVNALQKSKDVAKRGQKISRDMIEFCVYLLDPANKTAEIEGFLSDMSEPAEKATLESKQVARSFRDVRQGLYVITTDIPAQVAKLEEERKSENRKKELAAKRGERARVIKICSTAFAAVVGGVALIACPPALILLPIALPLISLVAEAFETRVVKKIAEREVRARNCSDAIEVLYKVSKDLAQLEDCIDEFAKFWTYIELLLETVRGRVEDLRVTNALRLRLKSIKSSWEEIAQSYQVYAVKIDHLCELTATPASRSAISIEKPNITIEGSKISVKSDDSVRSVKSNRTAVKGFLMI